MQHSNNLLKENNYITVRLHADSKQDQYDYKRKIKSKLFELNVYTY